MKALFSTKRSHPRLLALLGLAIVAAVALALLARPSTTQGLPNYFAAFSTKYGTAGSRIGTCGDCHVNPAGGGPRNLYGQAFEAVATHSSDPAGALTAIEPLDSDGDGFTNIAEINARTFPGDPNDKPGAATPTPTIDMASVARGGLLYDEWWEVVGASAPTGNQALWALQTTNTRTGADTWRCKECHGWDYKGKDGAYGSGSHKTGFPGVWDAAQSKTVAELAAILGGSTNAQHNFTGLQPADKTDLANFLKYGLLDMSKYVNYATKKPIGGNAAAGKTLFDGLCAACHGLDGKKLNFGTAIEPEYVDTVAKDNPQEFLHKARVGQPGSDPTMPSTLVLGWTIQQQVDVLTHAQTLPATPTPTAAATPAPTATPAAAPKTGAQPPASSDSPTNGWLIVVGAIVGVGILGSVGYVVARRRIVR